MGMFEIENKLDNKIFMTNLSEQHRPARFKRVGINLPEKDNSLRAHMFTTTFNQVTGKRLDPYYYLNTFINHIENSDYPFEKLAKHVKYFWSGFTAGKKEQSCSPIEKQKQIAKEANRRRYEAQRLEKESKETLEQARQEIEKLILE